MDKGKVKRIPRPDGWKPEPTFPKGHRYEGKPRCQAWNPKHGRQCGLMPKKLLAGGHPADPENYLTVCWRDGGKSPRGIDHYNYQGKGYSRFAPPPLEPTITAFLKEGDPLDLISAIATWEGRINQLLISLENGGAPGKLWRDLEAHWARYWTAFDDGKFEQAHQERMAIQRLINEGTSQAQTWEQIKDADELRMKLINSEDKKRDRALGYIRAEDVRHNFNSLRIAIVGGVELIEDLELRKQVRRYIAEKFLRITGPAVLSRPTSTD